MKGMISVRTKVVWSGVSLALFFSVSAVSAQTDAPMTYVVQNKKGIVGGIYQAIPNQSEKSLVRSGKSTFSKQLLAAEAVDQRVVYEKVIGTQPLPSYRCDSELFKVDILSLTNGKTKKIATEYVPPKPTEHMRVVNSSLYYVKFENYKKDTTKFSVVKSDLSGKKKVTLVKDVMDFWIKNDSIFVIKNDRLQKMNLDGKNGQVIKNFKYDLYPNQSSCGSTNYNVSSNSLLAYDEFDDNYEDYTFMTYEMNTSKIATSDFKFKIDQRSPLPDDINIDKKQFIVSSWINNKKNENKFDYNLYDFNGKKIKTLIKSIEPQQIISIDMNEGRILYSVGSQLKSVTF